MRYQPATSDAGPPVVLVMTTDGRNELLREALASSWEHLKQIPILARILVDDSGTRASEPFWPQFGQVIAHTARQGLAAAVRDGWAAAVRRGAEFVFHLEDDFTLNETPDLPAMTQTLTANPHLRQLSLKRQPVNAAEYAAGGFVQVQPELYQQWRIGGGSRIAWLEHRVCYSLNPHLAPRAVIAGGWPNTNEAGQTATWNAYPETRYGIWGRIEDPPRVTHIGHYRAPGWIE